MCLKKVSKAQIPYNSFYYHMRKWEHCSLFSRSKNEPRKDQICYFFKENVQKNSTVCIFLYKYNHSLKQIFKMIFPVNH